VSEVLQRHRARVPPGEMAYVEEGSGPAVVLLHGFPTSSHLWRDLVPLLAPRFRAVAPDLIGYGDSEKPPGGSLDIPSQAAYVRELLTHLGIEEFAAVGHDVGGGVAQLLAVEGGVRALVLLDSISIASESGRRKGHPIPLQQSDADRSFAERFVRLHLELGMSHRERLSDQDMAEYIRPWREDPPALVRAAQASDAGLLGASEVQLKELNVPTLVVWGEEDPFQPSDRGERLWEVLPAASIALLPGCSHFVTEDAAETVLPLVLQFLKSRYLGEEGHTHQHPAGALGVEFGVSFERPPHPGDELVDE
jgi:2-hydroxymuconate-semialdehyde hydrolase